MPWSLQILLSGQLGLQWSAWPWVCQEFHAPNPQADKDVVLEAVQQAPEHSIALKSERCEACWAQDGYTLSYASMELRADREVVTQAPCRFSH